MVWTCICIEMRFKQVLGVWRPQDLSPQVQPIITTPGHGSFPMGHSAQSFVIAETLKRLLELDPSDVLVQQLDRQAHRIGVNRVVAGVHFPVDLIAGQVLGMALAEFAQACATDFSTAQMQWHFSEIAYRSLWTGSLSPWLGSDLKSFQSGQIRLQSSPSRFPVWGLLWQAAQAEWAYRHV